MKRVKRPCDECPWRVDSEPGRFDPERWEGLRGSSPDERGFGPDFRTEGTEVVPPVLFACHKTPEEGERACAGWLATVGHAHPIVRLDVLTGSIPVCALEPGDDWPTLHPDFHATMRHDLMED